jgi:hypothetical protein
MITRHEFKRMQTTFAIERPRPLCPEGLAITLYDHENIEYFLMRFVFDHRTELLPGTFLASRLTAMRTILDATAKVGGWGVADYMVSSFTSKSMRPLLVAYGLYCRPQCGATSLGFQKSPVRKQILKSLAMCHRQLVESNNDWELDTIVSLFLLSLGFEFDLSPTTWFAYLRLAHTKIMLYHARNPTNVATFSVFIQIWTHLLQYAKLYVERAPFPVEINWGDSDSESEEEIEKRVFLPLSKFPNFAIEGCRLLCSLTDCAFPILRDSNLLRFKGLFVMELSFQQAKFPTDWTAEQKKYVRYLFRQILNSPPDSNSRALWRTIGLLIRLVRTTYEYPETPTSRSAARSAAMKLIDSELLRSLKNSCECDVIFANNFVARLILTKSRFPNGIFLSVDCL